MKCLVLFTLFTAIHAFAQGEVRPEILSEQQLGQKFVSVIQAARIEDTLIESSEFRECAEAAKFSPTASRAAQELNTAQVDAATRCFREKMTGKSAADLQKLSETLNLKGFQLVRSKNVQDITKFLTNRVYKKLTNIDLDETDIRARINSLKFSNRKLVDQRDFVELYRIELGKSALYEISRFCFTNLRSDSPADAGRVENTFIGHWGPTPESKITEKSATGVNDRGEPVFGQSLNGASQQDIYNQIKTSLVGANGNLDATTLNNFFQKCMSTITPLCAAYRNNNTRTQTPVPAATTPPGPGGTTSASAPAPLSGANACLTQNRLQEIRKAMKGTGDVLKDWNDNIRTGNSIKLDTQPQYYDSQNQADGFNSLSTLTSKDFLTDTSQSDLELQAKCGSNPNNPNPGADEECAGFLVKDDSYKKAIHDTDFNLRLNQEIELEKIKQLKDDGENLEAYLEKRGYLELKEDLRKLRSGTDPTMTEAQFTANVAKFFDAQRTAAIESIKSKVGTRQADSDSSGAALDAAVTASVQASGEEKARLAQVVLFSNIVTSNLQLQKADASGELRVIGQNTQGLNKELENNVVSGLFTNLRTGQDNTNANNSESFLEDIEFLDTVLGKPSN